jgi:pimeloyl-ACP methyl ester carboxylesterase
MLICHSDAAGVRYFGDVPRLITVSQLLFATGMDAALYKDITTSRGLNYHCYIASARESNHTLLFLHGFPSTSRDWRRQVPFFHEKGYGLIVLDMLGYGGTAKPTNVEAYSANLMAKDVVDILDSEGIQKVIVIGHDW